MGKSNKLSKRAQTDKRKQRFTMARELIWPTAPNEFARTALIETDLSSTFTRAVAPYNTIGTQNFFWRATRETSVAQTANADVNTSYIFRLSDFPGASDFTTVFDMYKLKAAVIVINPTNNMTALTGVTIPRLYSCIDYDDANTVTRAQIMQYDTFVETPPGSGVVRAVVPRMAMAAYGSSAFSSYANMRDQWIDMASTNVEHYGIKVVIEGGNQSTNLQNYVVTITGFWEFKATR